ncbi:MAG TPA: kelch repeat-containing protein, partial [Candidatus Solibacter sp.]|nr:kelch repeat-containing protein [Candidatus Solibacter sp.]
MSRAAACSARLADGRVLVAGGASDSGALANADLYSTDGTVKTGSPMLQPRANAACVTMADGRVLVTGGLRGKTILNTAEIYDPATDQWTDAGTMAMARSGHSAVLSPWGAVLIVGGEDSGTLEAFLTNNTFATLGKLETPRTDYALAITPSHKLLIFGGSSSGSTISSIEMFDPDTNKVTTVGRLVAARKNFAAAALYNGTVLVSGGIDANGQVVNTTEIFDPEKGESAPGPTMAQARANHQAHLLPNNGSVLLIGGNDRDGVLASTEVYTPWTGNLAPTGKMRNARSSMASSLLTRGGVLVAGGKGMNGPLSGSERYRFATIETGKLDYHPGEVASFTGSGWKPGEQVMLQVQAFPLDQHQLEFSAVAVADGMGEIKATG